MSRETRWIVIHALYLSVFVALVVLHHPYAAIIPACVIAITPITRKAKDND